MIPDRHLDRLEQDAADGKKLSPAHTILLIDALREAQAKLNTPIHLLLEANQLAHDALMRMVSDLREETAASEVQHRELTAQVEEEKATHEQQRARLDDLTRDMAELRELAKRARQARKNNPQ